MKVGAILDLLVRRGPHAFRAFVEALVETEQDDVADMLDAKMASRYRKETKRPLENTYPEASQGYSVPSPDRHSKIDDSNAFIDFTLQSVSKMEGVKRNQDDSNYSMKLNPRGRAVIFNIETFAPETNQKERFGSGFDVINLAELFKKLHFDVKLHTNLSKEEIIREIRLEQKAEHHKSYNAFVMVILSHGHRGKIISQDGQEVDINNDIVNQFNGDHCPYLRNKPKMFFIQACQGEKTTTGCIAMDGPGDEMEMEEEEDWLKVQRDIDIKAKKVDTIDSIKLSLASIVTHEQADLFVSYATTPGYKAWRHTAMGSWYIRDLVKVFAEYCHIEHVADMMVRVNQLVHNRTVERSANKQICLMKSNLKAKVFLLPGYFE